MKLITCNTSSRERKSKKCPKEVFVAQIRCESYVPIVLPFLDIIVASWHLLMLFMVVPYPFNHCTHSLESSQKAGVPASVGMTWNPSNS